ncbi:MAG: hypothetical protein N838_31070 [Thiohalocapsa sp. PB-PSB1]|jgi:hypothetical protein|nr:MAG: hypothetical protein N838_31070 [Thiohalocapsa sp. PB-PSB1]
MGWCARLSIDELGAVGKKRKKDTKRKNKGKRTPTLLATRGKKRKKEEKEGKRTQKKEKGHPLYCKVKRVSFSFFFSAEVKFFSANGLKWAD